MLTVQQTRDTTLPWTHVNKLSSLLFYWFLLSAPPEHYRCSLRWSGDWTFLIGWVDVVRICQIRKRSSQEMVNRDLPECIVDPGTQNVI